MKKIAFMFYGQPRSISEGLLWKRELINNIQKKVDVEVDFYYHFWDALSPSPVVVGKDHPWAKTLWEKRPHIPGYNWMNDLIRLHPSEILDQLHTAHTEYQLGNVNIDLTKCYIEHADLWYRNIVMPRIEKYAELANTEIRKRVIQQARDWWAWSGANSTLSTYSSGHAYNLIQQSGKRYDLIIRARMDMILYPFDDNEWSPVSKITTMIKDSEYLFPTGFQDEDQKVHHIEVSPIEYHSADTGIANADYQQYLGHEGLDVWYEDWENTLADFLAIRIFNYSLHAIDGYGSELAPNVHNVYLEFKRTIDKRNNFLVFASRHRIAPEVIIRKSLDIDWSEVTMENWQKIQSLQEQGAADTNEIFRVVRGF